MTEQTIFLAALENADPGERRAYADRACAGDVALREQVEALLAAHERSGAFLDVPAVEQIAAGAAQPDVGAVALEGKPEGADRADAREGGYQMGKTEAESPGEPEENALAFLRPSAKPGSLGRLGHYEVLEVLGQGGFGTVLKAFDEMLHRIVAIKVMALELACTSPARKRFLREARASAAIRHENVVAIYAVEEQPVPYLVMEYIAGETLQQKLDRVGPLDTPEVLLIGRQVAGGLAAAHALGLIHRDIKPSNILLETGIEQRVRITDFGLARAADDASLTQSGVVAGTPMYMAPEQAQGESIDHRADLFSLGSVLYVMCSGRPPFRASTTLAVLKRVAEDTPRRIREIIPDVPEWLCAIVVRLHAKKPGDRYGSAKEVADLLSRHLARLQQPAPAPASAPGVPAGGGHPASGENEQIGQPVEQGLELVPPMRRKQAPRFMLAACLSCGVLASILWAVTWFSRDKKADRVDRPPGAAATLPPALAEAPFTAEEARQHQEAWARYLGTKVEVENSIGMKLALIPAGRFLMGSPDEEPDRGADEGPRHEVVLTRPFYLGVHDVTVGQFRGFVQTTGYRTEAEKGDGAWRPFPDGSWRNDPQANWQKPGY